MLEIFEKLNFIYIIKAHIKTLKNDNEDRISKGDIFLFFGIPLVVAFLAVIDPFHFHLKGSIVNVLLSTVALSIPLLISVLVLMYTLGQNIKKNTITADKDLQVDIAKETSNSITFTILMCVCTVLSLGILAINGKKGNLDIIIIFSFIVYFLLGNIVLTILMVLKRVQILIVKSFE